MTFGYNRVYRLAHLDRYIKGSTQHRAEFEALRNTRKCVLVGSADYGNIGDIAISEATLAFLAQYFNGAVVDIPGKHFVEYRRNLEKTLGPSDILCYQGGGNMNDLYPWFEFERCEALETFPNARNIIMPQTIMYNNADSRLLQYAQKVYGRCKDLHLFAREARSAQRMKEVFPTATVELVPDIVLSLDPTPYIPEHSTREGIVVILRTDREQSLDTAAHEQINTILEQQQMPITRTDTVIDAYDIAPAERTTILSNMLTTFAQAQVVVTDRLHGMIFSAITQTPCVVFANNNHKIQGVYEWIKDLPYIRFAHDISELDTAIHDVLHADTTYPRERILKEFQPLITALR